MTWRVVWHDRAPFPEHHDFWAHEAAVHFAGILRDIGRQNVTIHQLPEGDQQ